MSATLKWNGDAVKSIIRGAIQDGLMESAQMIRDDSIAQVPVDSSELIGECKIDTSNIDGLEVGVYYDTEDALIQHEDMTLEHLEGGKAKFLEDPFNEDKAEAIGIIGDKISGVIG